MNKTQEELDEEYRELFMERMLSENMPQTEEQKKIALQRRKEINKLVKEKLQKQGYDLQELGIENW